MKGLPTPLVFALSGVLAALLLAEVRAVDEVSVREAAPTELVETHKAVLGAVGAVVAATLLVTLALFLGRFLVRMSVVIVVCACAVIVAVGMVTWAVTYTTSRDAINGVNEQLLLATAKTVKAVEIDLAAGLSIIRTVQEHTRMGLFDPAAPFPTPNEYLMGLNRRAQPMTRILSYIFLGLENGDVEGSSRVTSDRFGFPAAYLLMGSSANTTAVPSWMECRAANFALPPFDCSKQHVCGLNETADRRECARHCSFPPSNEFCRDPHGHSGMVGGYFAANSSMTPLSTPSFSRIDPRIRPWYKISKDVTWSEPFMWYGYPGMTSSIGLFAPDGTALGSIALDYSMSTLAPLLRKLPPSENSDIHILSSKHMLLASSMSTEELVADTGNAGIRKALLDVQTITNPDSAILGVLVEIKKRFSTMQEAMEAESLFYYDDRAVLSFPITAHGGFRLLAVIDVAVMDFLGEAEDASTRALLIAVGISLLSGLCLFAIVTVTLLPLQLLAADMEKVAWMKLDEIDKNKTSRIKEIEWMQRSFGTMVRNLTEFRQYLPQGMLNDDSQEALLFDDYSTETKISTIVFTDVQASTLCWEESSEGMRKALKIHNHVIRKCIAEHGGYEVKTIGDSFMIAFDDVTSALRCGLDIQQSLLEADWPEDVLNISRCVRTEDGCWAGLKVRIGVNSGECDIETNNAFGRKDYFGNTVNKAARLEGVCPAGAVCVPDDVLLSVSNKEIVLDNPIVMSSGSVTLRGIQDGVFLSCLLPNKLEGRSGAVTEAIRKSKEDAQPLNTLAPDRKAFLGERGTTFTRSSATRSQMHVERRGSHDRFKEKLQRIGSAAIACVEARFEGGLISERDDPVTKLNDIMTRSLVAMQRTNGTVVCVLGSSITMGWNTTKACQSHVEQSIKFVKLLSKAASRAFGAHVFVGLSHGPVLGGNVGMTGQKFVTSTGPAVTLSGLLCAEAMELGVMCLFSSLLSADSSARSLGLPADTLRTVQHWRVTEPAQTLAITQVNPGSSICVDVPLTKEDTYAPTPRGTAPWGDDYEDAFANKDYAKLEELGRDDPAIGRIIVMLKEHSGTTHRIINQYLLL